MLFSAATAGEKLADIVGADIPFVQPEDGSDERGDHLGQFRGKGRDPESDHDSSAILSARPLDAEVGADGSLIDAPELDQTCATDGNAWQCGADAKQRFHELIVGQRVDCQITGTDQYGRNLGRCSTEFLQLNEAMVELGWAVAYREYSQDYVEAEERAKLRQAGIWNSTFTMPSAHRLCPFEGIIEHGPEAAALPVCSNAVAGQPAQRQPLSPGSVH